MELSMPLGPTVGHYGYRECSCGGRPPSFELGADNREKAVVDQIVEIQQDPTAAKVPLCQRSDQQVFPHSHQQHSDCSTPTGDWSLGHVWRRSCSWMGWKSNCEPDAIGKPVHRGWRKTVIIAAVATAGVLVLNLILAIVSMRRFGTKGGVATIYTGRCDIVKRWNTSIHVFINILSTVLLSASSYTMQCLNSPTRGEVDKAHSKGISLDIGIPSVRNFRHMRTWKLVGWVCLCFSTLPLHLLWNSTFFMTGGASLFSYVVASQSFLSGASYGEPNAQIYKTGRTYADCSGPSDPSKVIRMIRAGYQAGRYTKLEPEECLQKYSVGDDSMQRNLIVIVSQNNTRPLGSCGYFPCGHGPMSSCGYYGSIWDSASSVIGVDVDMKLDSATLFSGSNFVDVTDVGNATADVKILGTWRVGSYPVEACYSETIGVSGCQLQLVPLILYIVTACNFVKLLCICSVAYCLWDLDEPILATVGDAVACFLERSDQSTLSLCLIDRKAVHRGRWQQNDEATTYDPFFNRTPIMRLSAATSTWRWTYTVSICGAYLSLGFFMLYLTFQTRPPDTNGLGVKFGAVNDDMLLDIGPLLSDKLSVDIVIANSFQVVLSVSYFLYNSIFTAQCAAIEWVSYTQGKLKPLRVTWPQGQQRSTYYLTLPYRWAVPLIGFSILMHFLISQSIFLARLDWYDSLGNIIPGRGFHKVGFSQNAVLVACCTGGILILILLVTGRREVMNSIPAHGNKSVVISAMCHVRNDQIWDLGVYAPYHEGDDMATRPLMWGATKRPDQYFDPRKCPSERLIQEAAGHCGFTTRLVEQPREGLMYY